MLSKELERELNSAVANGEPYGPREEEPLRELEASALRSFLAGRDDSKLGAELFWLRRIKVVGMLDLEARRLGLRLRFEGCEFDDPVVLIQASGSNIEFERCQLGGGLIAHQLALRWNLALDNAIVENGLHLHGAEIGGRLSLNGAELAGSRGEDRVETSALNGDGVEVEGGVFCNGLSATGEVRLPGATTAILVMVEATLSGHRGDDGAWRPAINGEGVEVEGGVFCNGLSATGEVRLRGARVGGQLSLNEAKLDGGPAGSDGPTPALNASTATLANGLFCNGLDATGEVRLRGARVGSQLMMHGATVRAGRGESGVIAEALDAGGAEIEGGVLADGLHAVGAVSLVGARIGVQLSLRDASLEAQRDREGVVAQAFVTDRAAIGGTVFLDRLVAMGEVRLLATQIGGQLSIRGAELDSGAEQRPALALTGASIDELLLSLRRAKGGLDLRDVRARILWDATDGEFAAPLPDRLRLEGFTYESFREPLSAEQRLEWVGRSQRENHFPGVYAELAAAFRRLGRRNDARKVGIANERRARRDSRRFSPRGLWSDLLFVTVGYGYRNWLALLWLLVPVGLGAAAFSHSRGSFTHTGQHPPDLVPALFAIDTTVPILELGQTRWWSATGGMAWVELGLAVLGYALVAAVIAAAAGLFNRDQV